MANHSFSDNNVRGKALLLDYEPTKEDFGSLRVSLRGDFGRYLCCVVLRDREEFSARRREDCRSELDAHTKRC